MTNYLKLTEFELKRFKNVYFAIIGTIILMQLAFLTYKLMKIKGFVRERIADGFQMSEIVNEHGTFSIEELFYAGPMILTIGIGVISIALYILFIWYRDWVGETMFIYRLMMLPTKRMNIFFSKLTTIVLCTLGIVIVQLGVLFVYDLIIEAVLPREFIVEQSIFYTIPLTPLGVIIPSTFGKFVLSYGIGIMSVCILFTAILIERAYRLKGIIFAVLYVALFIILFVSTISWSFVSGSINLYPSEYKTLLYIAVVTTTALQLMISNHLLEKRMNL